MVVSKKNRDRKYARSHVKSGREWGKSGGYSSRDFYDKSVEEHLVSADELMKGAKNDSSKYLSSFVRLDNAYQKVEGSSSLDDSQRDSYLAAIEIRADRLARKIQPDEYHSNTADSKYRYIAEDARRLRDKIRKKRKNKGLERVLAIFAFIALGITLYMVTPILTGAVVGENTSVHASRFSIAIVSFVFAIYIFFFLTSRRHHKP